ncbi:MAG: hypothetical protein MZV64_10295 [Ignavibacteriales bacterium]|nr:hypothetical protein [Ignavibacteriales bacterium]
MASRICPGRSRASSTNVTSAQKLASSLSGKAMTAPSSAGSSACAPSGAPSTVAAMMGVRRLRKAVGGSSIPSRCMVRCTRWLVTRTGMIRQSTSKVLALARIE